MPKSTGQKSKLLHLAEIFYRQTDEDHPKTLAELIAELARRGISAERKSLYNDMEELRAFGLDIETDRKKSVGYYLASRTFEEAELKLLVDSVQASKFITQKKSAALISKLETLTSTHRAGELSRQVYVTGRIKSMNESIYYLVDEIHRAILQKKKISFFYFRWDLDKKEVLKRDGKRYVASPFALMVDDENYYLLAYDDERQALRHFRVDKMQRLSLLEEGREGEALFADFDMASYSKSVFGMFGGEVQYVTLRLKESLIGVVIDRFGRDVPVLRDSEGYFKVTVGVRESPQFFGFLAGLGADVCVVSPASVKKAYQEHLTAALKAQEN